jgi:hypothetical protein
MVREVTHGGCVARICRDGLGTRPAARAVE